MNKLHGLKVRNNSFTGYYEDHNGNKVEVDGEFSVSFIEYDEGSVTVENCQRIAYTCIACDASEWVDVTNAELDYDDVADQIEDDISSEIDNYKPWLQYEYTGEEL